MYNYVWFRSDLRVADNPALHHAMHDPHQHKVCALFYVTIKQWLAHGWGQNKIAFVLRALLELANELQQINIELEIRYCDTFNDCVADLHKHLVQNKAAALFLNNEYEINECNRDRKVIDLLKLDKITVKTFDSQCLIPPGKILTKQNTPYTVFTPFKKACYEYLSRFPVAALPAPKIVHSATQARSKPEFEEYLQNPILSLWPCDAISVHRRLQHFCAAKIAKYQVQRDFPALDGTSSLSPYLAIGRISVQQCFISAIACNNHEFASGNPNVMCWISELIWRDFYKHIIWHFPDICKGHNFQRKYDRLNWRNPGKELETWQQGQTGIPIIDAAMRQMVATGWMHNRLRMVVAMFLTKNLLIDWRYGEQFFSEHLVDLDFAANNGGWQWSASTGTDSVPYFRIFNPITQSEKFDPQGKFIRQYCPELASLPLQALHNPSDHLSDLELSKIGYPRKMVDLSASRQRAIEYFKGL